VEEGEDFNVLLLQEGHVDFQEEMVAELEQLIFLLVRITGQEIPHLLLQVKDLLEDVHRMLVLLMVILLVLEGEEQEQLEEMQLVQQDHLQ
jgi:hypothetical protein